MVRILLVNPKTTTAMTDGMVDEARRLFPEVDLFGVTAERGVASIDGHHDELLGALAATEAIVAHEGSFDAAVIGCFGDPGLFAARELTSRPVVGIAEASFAAAMAVGYRFSVLTTLGRGVPPIEETIGRYGLATRCASVRATGLTVLEADADDELAAEALEREGRTAIEHDGADVLCLGCGGMVGLRARLEERLAVPVVAAVPAGIALAVSLVRLGLATSKLRAFKAPEPAARS